VAAGDPEDSVDATAAVAVALDGGGVALVAGAGLATDG